MWKIPNHPRCQISGALIVYSDTLKVCLAKAKKSLEGMLVYATGKLDTNWLGIPKEGYAFSNDVQSDGSPQEGAPSTFCL